ncbi:uncharacterized protein [Montipora foliosa]|uniref:uncharacterized protein isoform X2 n=1 Tax=Montipora foliosa TaxID=591990 RepID=UPI0035F1540F
MPNQNYGGMQPPFNSSVAPGVNNCQYKSCVITLLPFSDPASTGRESMYAVCPLRKHSSDSNPDMHGLPKDTQNDHNPGTPGEGDGQFGNLLPFSQDNDHWESVAILKIKESMQEEARRFENVDGTTDHQGEFFMQ